MATSARRHALGEATGGDDFKPLFLEGSDVPSVLDDGIISNENRRVALVRRIDYPCIVPSFGLANGGVAETAASQSDSRRVAAHLFATLCVAALFAAYMAPMLLQGWVPFDEGTLAQSAHRVLLGQMPHRDFNEGYTGGLTFVHAAAFRLLGENLVSLRVIAFGAVMLSVPAFYYIASRFMRPIFAAFAALAALIVGSPSYPASMPSWYNLVFAVFGCAALFRYLDSRRRTWMLLAGLCGGASMLVKIAGLYFVAGGSLFIVFHVLQSLRNGPSARTDRVSSPAVVSGLMLAFAACPLVILLERPRTPEIIELGLPIWVLCGAVAFSAWRYPVRATAGQLVGKLFSVGWPFALGALVPVLCLVGIYAKLGAVGDLYRGVIVLPQRYVNWTSIEGPAVVALVLGAPPVALLTLRRFSAERLTALETTLIAVGEIGVVAWSATSLPVAAGLWMMVRMACPWVVAAVGIIAAGPPAPEGRSSLERQQMFAVTAIAACCSLIEFPVDSYPYFLYVLPLFVVAAGALASVRASVSRRVASGTLAAFMLLGLLLRPVFMAGGGSNVVLPKAKIARLDLPRGGLVVRQKERDVYVALVDTIQRHSSSAFIYVSPDAPEVYFLAQKENPTRTLFDVVDDTSGRTNRVLSAIRSHDVDAIVVNSAPRFSGPMSYDLRDSLIRQFAESAAVGPFEVRWRR